MTSYVCKRQMIEFSLASHYHLVRLFSANHRKCNHASKRTRCGKAERGCH